MIFISYSWSNREPVRAFEAVLRAMGVNYWVDHEQLDLSRPLSAQIFYAIACCDTVMHLVSTASSASPWVSLEVFWARQLQKNVVSLELASLEEQRRDVAPVLFRHIICLTTGSAPIRYHEPISSHEFMLVPAQHRAG